MTLALDIERDLAERIRRRSALPDRLTVRALAAHYGVSATPVRRAIEGLEREGWLERLGNGRLVARRRAGATGRSGRCRRGARDGAEVPLEERVEREVLLMSLRGEAGFLREDPLAERMGVGRTRLRQVLHELAGAGFLDHVVRRGWRARPFDRGDMLAFLDVRVTLEQQALDLARPTLEVAALERFAAGNDRAAVAARQLDNGLHAYFVECSGNHYIRAFFSTHGRYYSRLFDHAAVDADALGEMAAQHVEILEHAGARRWARARRALAHHICSQAPVLGAVIDRLTASSPSPSRSEP